MGAGATLCVCGVSPVSHKCYFKTNLLRFHKEIHLRSHTKLTTASYFYLYMEGSYKLVNLF